MSQHLKVLASLYPRVAKEMLSSTTLVLTDEDKAYLQAIVDKANL